MAKRKPAAQTAGTPSPPGELKRLRELLEDTSGRIVNCKGAIQVAMFDCGDQAPNALGALTLAHEELERILADIERESSTEVANG